MSPLWQLLWNLRIMNWDAWFWMCHAQSVMRYTSWALLMPRRERDSSTTSSTTQSMLVGVILLAGSTGGSTMKHCQQLGGLSKEHMVGVCILMSDSPSSWNHNVNVAIHVYVYYSTDAYSLSSQLLITQSINLWDVCLIVTICDMNLVPLGELGSQCCGHVQVLTCDYHSVV